jgi:hypothetical protein
MFQFKLFLAPYKVLAAKEKSLSSGTVPLQKLGKPHQAPYFSRCASSKCDIGRGIYE